MIDDIKSVLVRDNYCVYLIISFAEVWILGACSCADIDVMTRPDASGHCTWPTIRIIRISLRLWFVKSPYHFARLQAGYMPAKGWHDVANRVVVARGNEASECGR